VSRRWLLFVILGLSLGLAGAQQATPPTGDKSSEPKKRRVEISADHLTYDDRAGLWALDGNVVIKQEDVSLFAPSVRYNADQKKAWAEGQWKIVDTHRETIKTTEPQPEQAAPPPTGEVAAAQPAASEGQPTPPAAEANPPAAKAPEQKTEELDVETTVTGDKVMVDMNAKVAVIEGHVTVVRVPQPKESAPAAGAPPEKATPEKPAAETPAAPAGAQPEQEKEREDAKAIRRKKATLTCDKLEYYYDEKRALGTGSVTVKQGERTAKAEQVEFKEKEDLLTVTDNVVVTDEKGQRLECDKAVINTADDSVEAWGIKMIGFVEEEEKKPAEAQPAETAPAEATPTQTPSAGTATPPGSSETAPPAPATEQPPTPPSGPGSQ